jgi:hypothetical protein
MYFSFGELLEKWNASEEQILEFISSEQLQPTFIVNDIASIKAFVVESNGDIQGEREVSPFDIEYELLIDNDGLGRHLLVEPKFKTSKLFYFEHSRQLIKNNKGNNVYFKHFENTQGSIANKIFDLNFIKNSTEFSAENVAKFEEKNTIAPKKKKESAPSQQQRKINNLLRLIYSLANSVEDFNPKNPYKSAELILKAIDIEDVVSIDTLSGYIKEAYELEQSRKNIKS